MKKVLFAIATAFVAMTASASNVEKIQFANAGDMSLGLMLGMPNQIRDAQMPYISADAMWGLKDGFINTKTFGQNGAIDLGAYIGYCHYGKNYGSDKWRYWEMPIMVRSGFHWEFVKNLDVYAGFQAGVAICHNRYVWAYDELRNTDTWASAIFGNYFGAKWMFTDVFGVKAEFSYDYIFGHHEYDYVHDPEDLYHDGAVYYRTSGQNLPWFAAGVTFNF